VAIEVPWMMAVLQTDLLGRETLVALHHFMRRLGT